MRHVECENIYGRIISYDLKWKESYFLSFELILGNENKFMMHEFKT